MNLIKTQGNFMVYGPEGERRAAFALESDKRLFEAALEEAAQSTLGPWFDWVEYREQHGRSIAAYRDASGAIVSVLNCEEQEANAAFIVRACKAHDALVKEAVFVVLVIKAGILEVSKVFAGEDAANEFWGDLQAEYNIDPLDPDSCAEDVLCLKEEVV